MTAKRRLQWRVLFPSKAMPGHTVAAFVYGDDEAAALAMAREQFGDGPFELIREGVVDPQTYRKAD